MAISLITWAGQTVTPKDDAIIQDICAGRNGILYGCAVSPNDNTITIGSGYGLIKGRLFEVTQTTVTVTLPSSGTQNGTLYIKLDLSNSSEPIKFVAVTGSFTPTKDANANYNSGIYEMVLATYTVSTSGISSLARAESKLPYNRTPIYASLADLGSSSKMYISQIFNSMTDGSIAILNQDAINGLPYSGAIGTAFIIRNTSTNGGCFFLTGTGYPNYKCNRDNTGGTWERLPCDSDIFYKENETITLRLCTGGFLAGGGQELWVSAPINRKLHSGRNLNLVSGKFIVRQNGGYLTTPSASYVDINTEMTDFSVYENEIVFKITNDSGWGGTHNDAVGVEGFIKVIEV